MNRKRLLAYLLTIVMMFTTVGPVFAEGEQYIEPVASEETSEDFQATTVEPEENVQAPAEPVEEEQAPAEPAEDAPVPVEPEEEEPVRAIEMKSVEWVADGSSTVTQSHVVGTVINKSNKQPNPSREDYVFTGWYYNGKIVEFTDDERASVERDGQDNITKYINIEVTGNTTITAHFAAKDITITWLNWDDSVIDTSSVAYGETPAYSGTPTRPQTATVRYSFAGWSPALAAATENTSYKATYNEIARYTIRFVDADEAEISSAAYDVGTLAADIVKPTDPTKAATAQYTYTFAGWTPAIVNVAGDATYKATYNSTVNKYTVTFMDDDGKTVLKEATAYNYGTAAADIVKPDDPTKYNTDQYTYEFTGWTPAITEVTANAIYTATYSSTVKQYTVTFVDEDGETVLKEATAYDYGTAGTDIEKPADPTKAATAQYTYTFGGWTPAIGDVVSDATYKATYNSTVNQYNVTFVDEDGETVLKEATAYDYGTAAANIVKPADPTKANTAQYTYEFSGWSPEIEEVTADATYKATFTETPVEYTVTYVFDGGTVATNPTATNVSFTVPYGTTTTNAAPPEVTKDGYAFVAWESADVDTPQQLPATMPAHNLNYKATWIKEHTVTFTTTYEGTTTTKTVKVNDGNKIPSDQVPKNSDENWHRTGVYLAGWYINGDQTFALDTTITGDITLTADYRPQSWTVRFNPAPGTGTYAPQYITDGEKLTAVADPVREGAAFAGWYNGDKKFTISTDPVTSDMTLTAKWQYKVTFNPDNDTASTDVWVIENENAVPLATNPTKEGYAFRGWFKGDANTSFDFANTPITADITLKAKWYGSWTMSQLNSEGGTITGNTILFSGTATEPLTRLYVEKDDGGIERPDDGWWIGVKFTAPDDAVAGTALMSSGKNSTLTDAEQIGTGEFYEGNWIGYWVYLDHDSVNYALNRTDDLKGYIQHTVKFYNDNTDTIGQTFVIKIDVKNLALRNKADTEYEVYVKAGELQEFTVKFFAENETEWAKVENVVYGHTVAAPVTNPTKENYSFVSWLDATSATEYNFDTPVTGNVTLIAKWYGIWQMALLHNDTINSGGALSQDGKTLTFSGTAEAPLTRTIVDDSVSGRPAGNYWFGVKFVAPSALIANNAQIKFGTYPYGAVEASEIYTDGDGTVWVGEWFAIGENTFNKAFAETNGIYTTTFKVKSEANGVIYSPEQEFTVVVDLNNLVVKNVDKTANTIVRLNGIDQTFAVSYDTAGGSQAPAEETVIWGNRVAAQAAPTKDGYNFLGWFENDTATTAFDVTQPITRVAATEADKVIALTARWEVNTWTMTYQGGIAGTLSQEGKKITFSGTAAEPLKLRMVTATHSDGSTLAGGYVGLKFIPGSKRILDATELYLDDAEEAEDVPERYPSEEYPDRELSMIFWLGVQESTLGPTGYAATHNGIVDWKVTLKDKTNTGLFAAQNFLVDIDCRNVVLTNEEGTENLAVRLNNIVQETKVTFALDGGSAPEGTEGTPYADQIVVWGNKAAAPVEPVRAGFNFLGWFEAGKDTAFNFDQVLDTTRTSEEADNTIALTARWEVNTWTMTYQGGIAGTLSQEGKKITFSGTAAEPLKLRMVTATHSDGSTLAGGYVGLKFIPGSKRILDATELYLDDAEEAEDVPERYPSEEYPDRELSMIFWLGVQESTLGPTGYAATHNGIVDWKVTLKDKTNTGLFAAQNFLVDIDCRNVVLTNEEGTENLAVRLNNIVQETKVTFALDGGSAPEGTEGTPYADQIVVWGNKAAAPVEPVRAGFNFLGWFEEGKDTAFDFTQVLNTTRGAEDPETVIALTAKWESSPWTLSAVAPDGTDLDVGTFADKTFSVTSAQVTYWKTLVGKNDDNVPGRPGDGWYVGVKFTAPATVDETNGKFIVKDAVKGEDKEYSLADAKDPDGFIRYWPYITEDKVIAALAQEGTAKGKITYPVTIKNDANDEGTVYNIVIDVNDIQLENKDETVAVKTINGVLQKFTVSFNLDGGIAATGEGVVGCEDQTVVWGNKAIPPADPSKEGFTFVNWRLENANAAYDFDTAVTSDVTLYAHYESYKWNVDVDSIMPVIGEYDSETGVIVFASSDEDEPIALVWNETAQQYEVSWVFDAPTAITSGNVDQFQVKVNGTWINLKLVADQENSQYVLHDGRLQVTVVESISIEEMRQLAAEEKTWKHTYEFAKADAPYMSQKFSAQISPRNLIFVKDKKIQTWFKDWVEVVEATLNYNNGTDAKVEWVSLGTQLQELAPTDPVKEGYRFGGWYVNGEKKSGAYEIEEDTTFEAKWYGNLRIQSFKDFETGKTWYAMAQSGDTYTFTTDETHEFADGDLAGTHVWQFGIQMYVPDTYVIDASNAQANGSELTATVTYTRGETVLAEKELNREAYAGSYSNQEGWHYAEWFNVTPDSMKEAVAGDGFRVWTLTYKEDAEDPGQVLTIRVDANNVTLNDTTVENDPVLRFKGGKKYYRVTFDLNGGTGTISPLSVIEGEKADSPRIPENPSGFKFGGWLKVDKDDEGHDVYTVYDFDTPVTADVALKANWYGYWSMNAVAPNGQDADEGTVTGTTITFTDLTTWKKLVEKEDDGVTTRPGDGWYVGVKFTAPVSVDETNGKFIVKDALTGADKEYTLTQAKDPDGFIRYWPYVTVTKVQEALAAEGEAKGKLVYPVTIKNDANDAGTLYSIVISVDDIQLEDKDGTVQIKTIEGVEQKFTLTYYKNEGEETPYETVEGVVWSNKAPALDDPTKDGFYFLGWVDEEREDFVPGTTVVTEDKSLTAQWESKTWTLSTVGPNGQATSPAVGAVDGAMITIDDLTTWKKLVEKEDDGVTTRPGDGWYVGVKFTAPTSVNLENVTIAIGESSYTWAQAKDGDNYFCYWPYITEAKVRDALATEGDTKGKLIFPLTIQDGANEEGTLYNIVIDVEDIQLEDKAGNIELKTVDGKVVEYTVTFDANGGTPEPEAQTVKVGKTAAKPENDPAIANSDFLGWFAPNATTAYDFSTPVTAELTLTAKWYGHWTMNSIGPDGKDTNPAVGTITGNEILISDLSTWKTLVEKDDGNVPGRPGDGWYVGVKFTAAASIDLETAQFALGTGDKQNVKGALDGDNWFGYWPYITEEKVRAALALEGDAKGKIVFPIMFYNDANDEGETKNIIIDVNNIELEDKAGNIELKTVNGKVVEYTVTFDANGGTPVPEAQTVKVGKTATEPETEPELDDFVFQYWTATAPGQDGEYDEDPEEFDFDTAIEADTTLYAYYILDEVTVTFNWLIEEEENATVTMIRGEQLTENDLPEEPVIVGIAFQYWTATDPDEWQDGVAPDAIELPMEIAEDTTVYAYWTPVEEETTVIFRSYNLMFEGIIQLRIRYIFPEELLALENPGNVVFYRGEEVYKTIPIKDGTEFTDSLAYFLDVPIKMYADIFSVQVLDAEGNPYRCIDIAGENDYTEGREVSVETYCDAVLAGDYGEAIENLVIALKDYGIASKIQFQYSDYATLTVDARVSSLTAADMEKVAKTEGTLPEGVTSTQNVDFEASNNMRAIYALPAGKTADNYTFTGPDPVLRDDGRYQQAVNDIFAKNLGDDQVFVITDGTNTFTRTTSPAAYCRAIVESGVGNDMKNLAKAMYLYWKAAKAYYGN